MSEHFPPRGPRHQQAAHQQAVDRLLSDSGLDGEAELRTELLELRSLADTVPAPSEAVRALMVSGQVAATQEITTTDGPVASSGSPTTVLATVEDPARVADPAPASDPAPAFDPPADELAARRRTKRRAAVASLVVVVSLAGGATAAAASDGGIPGTFQHLGAAIGTVVSQLAPGPGNAPKQDGPTGATPAPTVEEKPAIPDRNQPAPAPASPNSGGNPVPDSHQPPRGGASPQQPKDPLPHEPGNGGIPTPVVPVTPPGIDPSGIDPAKLRPSDIPVTVPTHVVPSPPANPGIPAK
ncbi:hypothetical protein [Paenarthrobacter nicotinovorans]|uniref:hypothetical protein n=1 Tax=Paenarthrobacter nicotinovorans TaxID=29320 RepID=UPI00047CE42F|nr:hypothetical protein [Paenarthrobacter nicotinovorans]